MNTRYQPSKRQGRSSNQGRRRTEQKGRGSRVRDRRGAARSDGRVAPGATKSGKPAPANKELRERLTLHLPVSLIERAKNVVYWTPGLTMTDLTAAALVEALVRMERKRGGVFPRRDGGLRVGRPLKILPR